MICTENNRYLLLLIKLSFWWRHILLISFKMYCFWTATSAWRKLNKTKPYMYMQHWTVFVVVFFVYLVYSQKINNEKIDSPVFQPFSCWLMIYATFGCIRRSLFLVYLVYSLELLYFSGIITVRKTRAANDRPKEWWLLLIISMLVLFSLDWFYKNRQVT